MLKVDLHLHSSEDTRDALDYSARDLIEHAAGLGYHALAITLHDEVITEPGLEEFAAERGVLFIRGIEKRIHGKEILIFNTTQSEMDAIDTFQDLRRFRRDRGSDTLVIAPHPFFGKSQCLGRSLEDHIDLFDAIEYCHLYLPWWNRNRPAERVARAHGKTLVATSDAHALWMFGDNFSVIDAPATQPGIFDAIRAGRVTLHHEPLTVAQFARKMFFFLATHKVRKARRFARRFAARPLAVPAATEPANTF